MEQALYAGIPIALAFSGWITYTVFQRPTRPEVDRLEDRLIDAINKMEARVVRAIEARQ